MGIGLTYSSVLDPLLDAHPDLVDVVEIEPQALWLRTGRPEAPYLFPDDVVDRLRALPGRKLVHSVAAPVGGTMRPDPAQLKLLRETVRLLETPWLSEHLSFNRTSSLHTGFFLPPRQTLAGVAASVAAIRDLQASVPVPIAVETGVNYLRPRSDEMDDASFVAAVVRDADCGILLDIHNVFANSLNGRQQIGEFLTGIPLERVWEIHIAGGLEMEGYWLDAHSGAIPEPLLETTVRLLPRLPNLKALIFEIFPSFVPTVGLDLVRAQMERLREVWDHRGAGQAGDYPLRPTNSAVFAKPSLISPKEWEDALGALANGRTTDLPFAVELAHDPGVHIIRRLVEEFRASMIVNVLRLTSRLLMLTLGPDVFRVILEDFWTRRPPQPFAIDEALGFARHLEMLDLKVPQLAGVLALEQAVVRTLTDGQTRTVPFAVNPLQLLQQLVNGQLSESPGDPGNYVVEVTPDGDAVKEASALLDGLASAASH
jgi:uncharacterized protein